MHYISLFGKKGSKVKVTRIVRTDRKGSSLDLFAKRRVTLATLRQRNAREYKYASGLAMIWPPLPGTAFWDDLNRISS